MANVRATTVSRKYWILWTAVILAVQALIIGTGLIQGSWFADDFI
ncbi:MAG: hypothetical protein QOE24_3033, partial [Frankiales bacterium]|nr:hypothetical protein [Frankiales bacterium]